MKIHIKMQKSTPGIFCDSIGWFVWVRGGRDHERHTSQCQLHSSLLFFLPPALCKQHENADSIPKRAVEQACTRIKSTHLKRALDLLDDCFGVGGCGNACTQSVSLFCVHSQCWKTVVKHPCSRHHYSNRASTAQRGL